MKKKLIDNAVSYCLLSLPWEMLSVLLVMQQRKGATCLTEIPNLLDYYRIPLEGTGIKKLYLVNMCIICFHLS